MVDKVMVIVYALWVGIGMIIEEIFVRKEGT